MASRALLVALMLVLAGCALTTTPENNTSTNTPPVGPTDTKTWQSEPSSPTDTGPESSTGTPTTTDTSNPNIPTTNGSPPTETPSPTDAPDTDTPETETVENPWGEEELTVAVRNETGRDRAYRALVGSALTYWETHSAQYAGYPIEYRLVDNTSEADVVVSFVPNVGKCGVEPHAAGCAPYLTDGPVERPAHVRIRGDYDDTSTVKLLRHELGHTLGLAHDDDPAGVMAAETELTTLPKPDATERALPWNHSELTVAVDTSGVPQADRKQVNQQINASLAYYAAGANRTVPKNVSFRRVDDPDRADIVVRFTDQSPCRGIETGSCSRVSGYDPDGDDALETYTGLDIVLTDVDTDAVAWHVGRWLGRGFGFDEEADYPPPLRANATYIERRSRWWK